MRPLGSILLLAHHHHHHHHPPAPITVSKSMISMSSASQQGSAPTNSPEWTDAANTLMIPVLSQIPSCILKGVAHQQT